MSYIRKLSCVLSLRDNRYDAIFQNLWPHIWYLQISPNVNTKCNSNVNKTESSQPPTPPPKTGVDIVQFQGFRGINKSPKQKDVPEKRTFSEQNGVRHLQAKCFIRDFLKSGRGLYSLLKHIWPVTVDPVFYTGTKNIPYAHVQGALLRN